MCGACAVQEVYVRCMRVAPCVRCMCGACVVHHLLPHVLLSPPASTHCIVTLTVAAELGHYHALSGLCHTTPGGGVRES